MDRRKQSQLITAAEAARRLGIDARRIRDAIAAGQVPSIKIGRRDLIPAVVVERLLENY